MQIRLFFISILFLGANITAAKKQKTGAPQITDLTIANPFPLEIYAQSFTFNPEVEYEIRTKADAIFTIPAGAFKGTDNSNLSEVKLEIRVFIQKLDFLHAPIRLEHNRGYFESAGMFEIKPSMENLNIKLTKQIKVEFPNLYPGDKYHVYHFTEGNWVLHGHNQEKVTVNKEKRTINFGKGGQVSGFRQTEYLLCDPSKIRKISGFVRYQDGSPAKNMAIVNEITFDTYQTDEKGFYEINLPGGCEMQMSISRLATRGVFKLIKKDEYPKNVDITVSPKDYYIGYREELPRIGVREYLIDRLGYWNFDSEETRSTCISGTLPNKPDRLYMYTIALKRNLFAYSVLTKSSFKVPAFPGETHRLIGYTLPLTKKGKFMLYIFKPVKSPEESKGACTEAEYEKSIEIDINSPPSRAELINLTGLKDIPYKIRN